MYQEEKNNSRAKVGWSDIFLMSFALHPVDRFMQNSLEKNAVLKLAKHFESEQLSYRIITPYEAQRSSIEEDMEEAKLDWGDKVFNVDSFQGFFSSSHFPLNLR